MTTRAKEIRELGNTGFLELDANGNVGIGTGTNVDELLHIEKTAGTTLVKTEVAANSTVGLEIAKTGSTTQSWRIVDGQTVNGVLEFYDLTNTTTRMSIKGNGSIGIGTASPVYKLQVDHGTAAQYASSIRNTADNLQLLLGTTTGGLLNIQGKTISSNAAYQISLQAEGGNVGIGTTNPSVNLEVSDSGNSFILVKNTSSGSGLYIKADTDGDAELQTAGGNNDIVIRTAGNERVRFKSSGNVGIGTDDPSAPIDVVTNSNVYAAEFTQSNTANGDGVSIVIGSTAASEYALTVRSDAGNTSVLAAKADGKVGIGVFTPSAKLHVENTAAGNAVYIDNNYGWTAANLSEFSNSAFTIRPRQADVYLKTSGSSGDVRFQAINNANDTAHDIKLNPYGGKVGVKADGNLTADFTVNKPATGHTSGYQEDIAQFYTKQSSYLGRHYLNFFHDNNNRDASGHHTVWGMAFGYDDNTRGGIQYDHKGQERMTLWSSYGSMQFKVPSTAIQTHKAHTLTEDPVLELKNNGNNMRPRQSAICLTLPSSQGWSNGNSWIKVNLTSVVYQKGVSGAWDSGNGRYVCPETGLYLCTTSVQLENNGGSIWRYLFPCINGSTTSGVNGMNFADLVPQDSPNSTYYHHAHTCILRCNSGDYIEWKMTGSGGGSTIKPGGETACCVYFMG